MTLDSWMSGVVRPLGVTNWLAWPFLILVMLVFTIGFLNLMTAIFVESIMLNHDKVERRRYDSNRKAERQCGECAATLFRLLKVSGDHSLSRAQLLDTLGLLAKRQYAANHGEPVLDDEVTDALVRLAPTNTDWESVLRAVYQDPRDSERGRLTRHDFEALLLHAREPTIRQDTWSVESQLEELQCTSPRSTRTKRVDELATRTEAQFQHARALEKLALKSSARARGGARAACAAGVREAGSAPRGVFDADGTPLRNEGRWGVRGRGAGVHGGKARGAALRALDWS